MKDQEIYDDGIKDAVKRIMEIIDIQIKLWKETLKGTEGIVQRKILLVIGELELIKAKIKEEFENGK